MRRRTLPCALLALVLLAGCEKSLAIGGPSTSGPRTIRAEGIMVAPAPAAAIGASDATLELWIKTTAADRLNTGRTGCGNGQKIAEVSHLIPNGGDTQIKDVWQLGITAGGELWFRAEKGPRFASPSEVGGGTSICTTFGDDRAQDGTWHHVAAQRTVASGAMQLWFDGALVASGVGPAGAWAESPTDIGMVSVSEPDYPGLHWWDTFEGRVDELRISSVKRYAAPFTPPAAAFTPDASTRGLWHFNGTLERVTVTGFRDPAVLDVATVPGNRTNLFVDPATSIDPNTSPFSG